MNWSCWIVLAAVMASHALLGQSGGVVEGLVANAVTGAPVVGVKVELTRAAGGSSSVAYRATTDAQGLFRIEGVKEEEYTASFKKDGFMGPRWGSSATRPFRVAARSASIRLQAEIVPYGKLSGRVIDSEGQPVTGIDVGLSRVAGYGRNFVKTDALGRFVFPTAAPGSYLLAAWPLHQGLPGGVLRPRKESLVPPPQVEGERREWASTFYPGVTHAREAMHIIVRAGADLPGYEIRLRAGPVHRVQGMVLDSHGRRAVRVPVKLTGMDTLGITEAETVSTAGGSFELKSVHEGQWRLLAQTKVGETHLRGLVEATVSHGDVEALEIRLTAPFRLEGRVEREEPRDAEGKRKLTAVYLVPADGPPEWQTAAFHEQDGHFTIKDVHPGRYRILPAGFVPDYYVASVLLGAREVLGQEVDLTEGAPPIRVIYRPNAGRVRGNVDKGEDSTVVLVPQDEALLDTQFIRTARCGAGGRFEVGSLRPGAYYAFAFDQVDLDALADPVFVRSLVTRAVSIHVDHGETASVELRVTSWIAP